MTPSPWWRLARHEMLLGLSNSTGHLYSSGLKGLGFFPEHLLLMSLMMIPDVMCRPKHQANSLHKCGFAAGNPLCPNLGPGAGCAPFTCSTSSLFCVCRPGAWGYRGSGFCVCRLQAGGRHSCGVLRCYPHMFVQGSEYVVSCTPDLAAEIWC